MAPAPVRPLRAPRSGLTPIRTGNLNLTLVTLAYTQAGWRVFHPVGDGTVADFLAVRETPAGVVLEAVQIKAACVHLSRGCLTASLRNPSGLRRVDRTGGDPECARYRREDIDAFALATDDGRVYRLPVGCFGAGMLPSSVALRFAPAANGQSKGTRAAAPFELPLDVSLRVTVLAARERLRAR